MTIIWKVKLEGKTDDLEARFRCFTESTCRITKEADGFYLTSTLLRHQPEQFVHDPPDQQNWAAAEAVRRRADEMVTAINGATYLEFRPYDEVHTTDVLAFNDDGTPHLSLHYGVGTSTKLWPNNEPKASSNPSTWLELAVRDASVAEASELFGQQPKSHKVRARNLYNVLEVVRDDVGKHDQLVAKGWLTRRELSDCFRSLNMARHPPRLINDPSPPLAPGLVEGLVRRLLKSWINEKLSSLN